MDKRTDTTEAQPRDTLVANAMRALESDFGELKCMAGIAATLMDPHADYEGEPGSRYLRIPEEEAEHLSFAVYETDRRVRALMKAYNSAYHAGRGE